MIVWSFATHLKTLEDSHEALANALRDLETVRLTRPDDPSLSELKDDIRRTIERNHPEN